MSIDVQILREALRQRPVDDEESENDLAIEQMGNEAFDWILGELRGGSLLPQESIRGLRLLARLTRQFCVARKGDLLDFAIKLAESPSIDRGLRSAAAHIAIVSARIARGLGDPIMAYGRSVQEIYAQVRPVVHRALEIGLTPEVEAFSTEFLATSEPTP